MIISQNGVLLIESFEGFSPTMYLDAAGLPTIGYGTLIDEADEQWLKTATIDRSQAEQLLRDEMSYMEKRINMMLKNLNINQNQYDSLCSFAYNVGVENLRKSTLLRKVMANSFDPSIKNEFLRWVYANGRRLPGLITRRTKEAELYFS